jgi:hypothetical protein
MSGAFELNSETPIDIGANTGVNVGVYGELPEWPFGDRSRSRYATDAQMPGQLSREKVALLIAGGVLVLLGGGLLLRRAVRR